ncbi:polysaccharide pyruvyl transferase family protein [Leptolyngbya cf. ectocarpi LEGE 11479]|uniref:Polysaccharide pyruvyl transferase family protein n=1 Tax=Leptolyngbya cf. ectocarpi LEGE 11479 TaxID=1828722 RepID=A0A929FB29_LEPEC|nr:polysaccharide pyruvyl transferase family protein [Leptolyngbya ectocarpi]MBE9068664.1 polysaccharide pyruvyl transferase family protein [Leptolyngbya cf. ectocarpi LEGE 11479]
MVSWKRLLICGFYGHHNLGDEAMLAGMLCLLKRCLGEHYLDQITVYSNDPEDTVMRHSVAALPNQFPRRRRERWVKWATHTLALWQHQYFILGGGDLLRDSPERDVALTWLQPLQRAMALGCRTIVLGISVGEVWKPHTRTAIVNTLNRVDLIVVRDQQSQLQLQQMGVTGTVYIMGDLALQLIPKRSTISLAAPAVAAPHVGISIRSLTGRLAELDHAAENSFYREMARIIDYLIEIKGATVSLLPFQAYTPSYIAQHRPADNDEEAIAAVLEHSSYSQQIVVHKAFASVKQAIDTLQAFDLMIGTRLHSLILAAGLGIPLLAAAYDRKVSGFMTEIDQQDNSVWVQQFTLEQVKSRLDSLLDHRLESQQQLVSAVDRYCQQSIPVADRLCKLLNS